MDPRGCNLWQPVANGLRPKPPYQAKTVAVACDQVPEPFHGKECDEGGPSPVTGQLVDWELSKRPASMLYAGLVLSRKRLQGLTRQLARHGEPDTP
jgi:hypothetical protein